jgi:hypothetical protein
MWPALVALSISADCLGMFIGVASLGKRGDVLLSNGAHYLVLLTSGAVASVNGNPVLYFIGRLLPGTHALALIRTGSWHGSGTQLFLELGIGAVWLALGQLLIVVQTRRVREGGFDDYA